MNPAGSKGSSSAEQARGQQHQQIRQQLFESPPQPADSSSQADLIFYGQPALASTVSTGSTLFQPIQVTPSDFRNRIDMHQQLPTLAVGSCPHIISESPLSATVSQLTKNRNSGGCLADQHLLEMSCEARSIQQTDFRSMRPTNSQGQLSASNSLGALATHQLREQTNQQQRSARHAEQLQQSAQRAHHFSIHLNGEDTSSTMTKLSVNSLTIAGGGRNAGSQRDAESDSLPMHLERNFHSRQHHPQQAPSRRHSLPTSTPPSELESKCGFKWGKLDIGPEMAAELRAYRRMIIMVCVAMLYGIIMFCSVLLRSSSEQNHVAPNLDPRSSLLAENREPWTQEMIYGWYRDRPLNLAKPIDPRELAAATTNTAASNSSIGVQTGPTGQQVRECRSKASIKKIVAPPKQNQTSSTLKPSSRETSGLSNGTNVSEFLQLMVLNKTLTLPASNEKQQRIRLQRKFEALNGCLYRLDSSSESMGDLCCCAGLPKFIMAPELDERLLNTTKASRNETSWFGNYTSSVTTTSTSTTTDKPLNKPAGEMRRVYLRPQIMCFPSKSASLFNADGLVAPIANEYTLKHAFIKDKGKCITCSCCHEHDPDRVNKLLANVALYLPESQPVLVDKDGNEFEAANPIKPDRLDSIWTRIRDKLVGGMRILDRSFFWMLDLVDAGSLVARYGSFPTNITDSDGLILSEAVMSRPLSFERQLFGPKSTTKKPHTSQAEGMYLEEDSYDPFTSTTSTTAAPTIKATTTTTTSGADSRRASAKRKFEANLKVAHPDATDDEELQEHEEQLDVKQGKQPRKLLLDPDEATAATNSSALRLVGDNSPAKLLIPIPANSIPFLLGAASTTTQKPTALIIELHALSSTPTTTTTTAIPLPLAASKQSNMSSATTAAAMPQIKLLTAQPDEQPQAGSEIDLLIRLHDGSTTTTTTAAPRLAPGPIASELKESATRLSSMISSQSNQVTPSARLSPQNTPNQTMDQLWLPSFSSLAGSRRPISEQGGNSSIVISLDRENSSTILATIDTLPLSKQKLSSFSKAPPMPTTFASSAGLIHSDAQSSPISLSEQAQTSASALGAPILPQSQLPSSPVTVQPQPMRSELMAAQLPTDGLQDQPQAKRPGELSFKFTSSHHQMGPNGGEISRDTAELAGSVAAKLGGSLPGQQALGGASDLQLLPTSQANLANSKQPIASIPLAAPQQVEPQPDSQIPHGAAQAAAPISRI